MAYEVRTQKTTIGSRNRSAMPPRNDKDTDQSSHDIDNALSDRSWELSHEPFSEHSASRLHPAFHPVRRIAAFGLWRQQHFGGSQQSMGGNGLIVSFGEVMPMRLGRLQRQSRRAFWASAAPEVSTSELAGWCWARQTLVEKRAPSRWQREAMIRAARSIGAVRTRRIGREWLWRLPNAVAPQALSRV